jgi:hypothetical protein
MKNSILLLFFSFVSISCLLATPMIGAYTIGGIASDFTTIQSAIDALQTNGMAGDIILSVNSGTYDEQIEITGLNPSGLYSIQLSRAEGTELGDVVLTNSNASSFNNFIIKVDNSSRLSFSGLKFQSQLFYGTAIYVAGDSSEITIAENKFSGFDIIDPVHHSLIYMLSDSDPDRIDDIVITGNEFHDGGFQIHLHSTTSTAVLNLHNIEISDNIFNNGIKAIHLDRSYYAVINNNIIADIKFGIEMNNGAYPNIFNNRLSTRSHGIKLTSVAFALTAMHTNAVYNNIVTVSGLNDQGTAFNLQADALNVTGCNYAKVFHNTLILKTETSLSSYAASFTNNTEGSYLNNQIIAYGTGMALNLGNTDRAGEDYNNIFALSKFTIRNNNINYVNYTDYLAANSLLRNSMSLDPVFEDEDEDDYLLYSIYLQNKGTQIDFITTDIAGTERNETNPDIGAYESEYNEDYAPLAGTYQIGSLHLLGSLDVALEQAALRGISADVFFVLAEPYTGNVTLRKIPGASADNVLQIEGNAINTISHNPAGADDNYLVTLARSSYVHFQNVTFSNQNTTHSNLVRTYGFVSDVTFNNSTFIGSGVMQESLTRSAYYAASDSVIENIEFNGCEFLNNTYGLYISPHTGSNNLVLKNSQFTGNYKPVHIILTDDIVIDNNQFINSFFNNISLNNLSGFRVTCNKIDSINNNSGILLSSCSGSVDTEGNYTNLIANNIIRIIGPNNGGPEGIKMFGNSNHLDILHNSIDVSGTNAKGIGGYSLPTNSRIINNAIRAINGLILDFAQLPGSGANLVIDYNCYYSEEIYLTKIQQSYVTLNDFRAAFPDFDANSHIANPFFTETMQSNSPWVKDKAFWTNRVTIDHWGSFRDVPYDIGAYEFPFYHSFYQFTGNEITVGQGLEFEDLHDALTEIERIGITTADTLYLKLDNSVRNDQYRLNYIPRPAAVYNDETGGYLKIMPIEPGRSNPLFSAPDGMGADQAVFTFRNAERVVLKQIDFQGLTTINRHAVNLTQKSRDIVFSDCSFSLSSFTSATTAVNARTSYVNGIRIKDSGFVNFETGYSQSRHSSATPLLQPSGLSISGNQFSEVRFPVETSQLNSILIKENTMSGILRAISISNSNDNAIVRQNKVYVANLSGTFSNHTLISFSNLSGENNAFQSNILLALNNSNSNLTGVDLNNVANMDIDHNTLYLEKTNKSGTNISLNISSAGSYNIRNNVLVLEGSGKAFQASTASGLTMSNNVLYSLSTLLATLDGINYDSIEAWHTATGLGAESYYLHPFLDTEGMVKSEFLKGKGTVASFHQDVDGNSFITSRDIGANRIVPEYNLTPVAAVINVGEHYPTLQAALDAVSRRGVSNNTSIYVSEDLIGENYIVRPFPLSSPDRIVRVAPSTGTDVTLSHNPSSAADNYLFNLRGVDFFTLKGFNIDIPNADFHTAVELTGINRNISIESCDFSALAVSTTNVERSFIRINSEVFDGLLIEDCSFTDGGTALYAVGLTDTEYYNDLVVYWNAFINLTRGLYLRNLNNITIQRNYFDPIANTAIDALNMNGKLQIFGNYINHRGGYGVYLDGLHQEPGLTNYIYNNFIRNDHQNLLDPERNLYIANANKTDIVNNTFRFTHYNAQGTSSAFEKGTGCSEMRFINNIFSNNQTGYAAVFTAPEEVSFIDYNLFYGMDENKVLWGSENYTSEADFPATGNFSNSLIGDPLFVDPWNIFLHDDSPAIDAGVSVAYVTTDMNDTPRVAPYDIGAWQKPLPNELDPPQNVSILYNAGNATIEIYWDIVPGANRYTVEYANDPYGEFTPLGTTMTNYFGAFISDAPEKRFYRIVAKIVRESEDNERTKGVFFPLGR